MKYNMAGTIGLINVDSPNGNLALAKLSKYWKDMGYSVELALPWKKYDLVYASKIFTWTKDNPLAQSPKVLKGGSGYSVIPSLPDEIEHRKPDYGLFGWNYSIGFTTRGCPKNCSFCLVPEKEGKIQAHAEIEEFYNSDFHEIILLDNNITAHPHGLRQLEKLSRLPVRVDCNQGIDKEYIDDGVARLLAKVKWIRTVRLACNNSREIPALERAVKCLRSAGVKREAYFVYLLLTDDIRDCEKRALACREMGLDPWVQPFRSENNNEISKIQMRFAKFVNRKKFFKTAVNFRDFYRFLYPGQLKDLEGLRIE